MKILLVEDDTATRQLLALHLTTARYTVEQATDGATALELALEWSYGLIILDLNLPHLDGLSFCRKLRRQGSTTPILILTAKTGNEHIVTGLDAGADDYVTKPFEVESVMARVRALLRRGATATEIPTFVWGAMELNPALAQVTYEGQVVPLTPKEYNLLELFLRHPQRIFSRSSILDHLWSIDDSPTEGAVTNLVKDLRSRLRRSGVAEPVIQTVYGLGYRLGEPPTPQSSVAEAPIGLKTQDGAEAAAGVMAIAQRFQAALPKRLAYLEQAIHRLQTTGLPEADRRQVKEEAHRLAGGLGTFGYQDGSPLAHRLEVLLSQDSPFTDEQVAEVVHTWQDLNQAIQIVIQSAEIFPRHGREGGDGLPGNLALPLAQGEGSRPPALGKSGQGCRVLAVNLEASMAQTLGHQLPQYGYLVEICTHLPDFDSTSLPPDVGAILLGLDPTAAPGVKLAPLSHIRRHHTQLPVLVITAQESLEERVQVARLQGHRYLVAPISPHQVIEALEQVLPCTQPPESRVLVVEDDSTTLEAIKVLLSPWGLRVFGLSDPRRFWDCLREVQPDLLLLALDTPTFSGFDLCQVVRQDPTYGNLPTLMLASHPDTVTVNQVFEVGGDDLIGKPIVGPELVTRVLSRVERSRLRQQLDHMRRRQAIQWVQPDGHNPLTQVATASHLETFLRQQWNRHCQDRAPLALLLCMIDDFTAYHQAYGQGASAEVLRRIARTLYHTINSNIDLVARSGEAQFSLVLPNTTLDGALRVATRIQQAVNQLQLLHRVSPRRPQMTVSLGLSSTMPTEEITPDQLVRAAEQALGEAQARGGDTLSLYPLTR